MIDLPNNRLIVRLQIRVTVPSQTFSAMPDMPLYVQRIRISNLALTHEFTPELFLRSLATGTA